MQMAAYVCVRVRVCGCVCVYLTDWRYLCAVFCHFYGQSNSTHQYQSNCLPLPLSLSLSVCVGHFHFMLCACVLCGASYTPEFRTLSFNLAPASCLFRVYFAFCILLCQIDGDFITQLDFDINTTLCIHKYKYIHVYAYVYSTNTSPPIHLHTHTHTAGHRKAHWEETRKVFHFSCGKVDTMRARKKCQLLRHSTVYGICYIYYMHSVYTVYI